MLPVEYTPAAERYFRKLRDKRLLSAFENAITLIRENPSLGQAKKGDLAGIYSYDIIVDSVNYELAYRLVRLNNGSMIVIVMAGTRENFYRELRKYMR